VANRKGVTMTKLFIFGLGYSATAVANEAQILGCSVAGTVREFGKAGPLKDRDIETAQFTGGDLPDAVADLMRDTDRVLMSIPPGDAGDPVVGGLARYFDDGGQRPKRVAYLSSLSVYGDFNGAWIDETAKTDPASKRGRERLCAEAAWRHFGQRYDIPVDILRLAGIYGPGRNTLLRLQAGTARRITGTGHVFNRIHVADIARIALALMQRDGEGGIFNVCDNEPVAQEVVVAYAANLLGIEPPPAIPLDEAGLSPLGRSFYEENKKVSNRSALATTGLELRYPTYREGLTALAARL
jgi:nucleoside-diphosphate-sugar epimerase